MLKTVITLLRGAAHDAEERLTDQTAFALLQQQMRDAGSAVASARKAVALAMAQQEQERRQHAKLLSQIEDLETRAIDALRQEKQVLADEAAEALALLEDERATSQAAQDHFTKEIARLRHNLKTAEGRLRDLKRGQRLAAAGNQTATLRNEIPPAGLSALSEAEATLNRLQARQREMDLTAAAMEELSNTGEPASVIERLAEAGCGKPTRTRAEDVLTRLKSRL